MKQLYYLFLALRPKSWIKNIIIFLPLIFSGDIINFDKSILTSGVFLIFCLFVGATYIINDYKDIENDKLHPKKKNRPLASGKLSKNLALIFSCLILFLSIVFVGYYYGIIVFLLFLVYRINTTLYTLYLKKIEIIDVFSIAIGFVIRGLIGIFVLSVSLSPWFMLILFFGALWLGFVKRYQEVQLGTSSRAVIKKYNAHFLEQIISIMTTTLLVSYAIYTFNSSQSERFLFTLPIVAFLIIRMYYNIFFLKKFEENFENIILSDRWIILGSLVYISSCICIILL